MDVKLDPIFPELTIFPELAIFQELPRASCVSLTLIDFYKLLCLEFTMMLGGRRIEERGFGIHSLSLSKLSLLRASLCVLDELEEPEAATA